MKRLRITKEMISLAKEKAMDEMNLIHGLSQRIITKLRNDLVKNQLKVKEIDGDITYSLDFEFDASIPHIYVETLKDTILSEEPNIEALEIEWINETSIRITSFY